MIKGIRLYRLRNGLSIDDAINALNISKSTLYKIEQGYLKPSLSLLNKMRKLYNCTSDELLDSLNFKQKEKAV